MKYNYFPKNQGLYDAGFEKDSCGVGFLCNIKGKKTNSIIKDSLKVLRRLVHRGAVGSDPKTGDGAGILIQTPHNFFAKIAQEAKISLPAFGCYGSGLVFLPTDKKERTSVKNVFLKIIKEEGQIFLGWRNCPVDNTGIGKTARDTEPSIEQIFVGRNERLRGPQLLSESSDFVSGEASPLDFERSLYVIRKRLENIIRTSTLKQKSFFYITNLSCRTFSYKGLLMPHQVEDFFVDLKDPDVESALAIVHSRYSTNTFPTWDLSQPFRFLAHNGEINTLRGNINWMRAREGLLKSHAFGANINKLKPVIVPGGSDSAAIDNIFELLVLSGRSLAHSMMMLIPAAWESNNSLDEKLKSFYKYHRCFMEPWDGPAAIAFTDGAGIGAVLDRNGLRPARYLVTKNDFVVMASEVGVLAIAPEDIVSSGRLEPGKIFYVDTGKGEIVEDNAIKEKFSGCAPYKQWLAKNMAELDELPRTGKKQKPVGDILTYLKAFGYTREDLEIIIKPMAETGAEPTGSMGNDTPHAVLSKRPQLLYNYFKQLFAQVTNPAIDPIREELVMSLESFIGREKNLLDETPLHCHKLRVKNPVLLDEDLEKIRCVETNGFRTKTISMLFSVEEKNGFQKAVVRICKEAVAAIKNGYTFIILSDRSANEKSAALPALAAVGAVHQHLVENAMRTQIGIIIESGEPREVHHFALLFGYGADCVNPYLVYQAVKYLIDTNTLSNLSLRGSDSDRSNPIGRDCFVAKNALRNDTLCRIASPFARNDIYDAAEKNYIKAVENGLLKILSKMGISTLHSYRGAEIFEALGVNEDVIDKCFKGTVSRIGGVDFKTIAEETILRHNGAYEEKKIGIFHLNTGGVYQWKKDGEFHLWNPATIAILQDAVRNENFEKYKEFAGLINPAPFIKGWVQPCGKLDGIQERCCINNQSANPTTLRSLLKFKSGTKSISIDKVEPVSEIVKRFATGAMSFGSISKEAHETIAIAMNRLGGRSNTGEGGEDPERFKPLPNGDSKRSAIKQIASGRFGVTTNYLVNADELQIKIAQGAKPGEGGQLPGHKVSAIIAKTRYTTPGVTLISPPPHHDIYSIEDLAQLIFDLKNVNPRARISVKLVSEVGVGTIAAGVAKGHADMILISGGDGGTGASPMSSIKHAGLPWELGISEAHQTLVLNELRSRVRLQTDGQMRTGFDVAVAALLGAEEFGFCTSVLIVLGCVMLRHCNLNNCSVGIATQDEILRKRFSGDSRYVENYFRFVGEELRQIMAGLGISRMDDMIGRTDSLEVNKTLIPWKAGKIDYSRILYKPEVSKNTGLYCRIKQDHKISDILDIKLIEYAKPALEKSEPVKKELAINNTNRTTGAMLSGEVCKKYGERGLPDNTIHFKFKGVAGQSFGAWLAKGITVELEGLANDYVGKGVSGGKIILYPDEKAGYKPEENIIAGNTCLYGAISGEAYIRGVAGERFGVRNSGLNAVVEGVGDHGCEYMTGGRVVILGPTGRNFGAGMSGGIAYIYDEDGHFKNRCNMVMVELQNPGEEDKKIIHTLLHKHYGYTKSSSAKRIIDNFDKELEKFVKVMPLEYKRILET